MRKLASLFLISSCAFLGLHAQDAPKSAATAPPASFKQVFLYQVTETEKKLVGLAEAMPEAKFTWRPAEGVRSVSETFMHEAGANVFFLNFMGVKAPAGFDEAREKSVTKKADVIQAMKDSFAYLKKSVTAMTDEDLTKTAPFIGGHPQTYQSILFITSDHMHEHLGQLIAYARMNGVVPPWSKGKEN